MIKKILITVTFFVVLGAAVVGLVLLLVEAAVRISEAVTRAASDIGQ